MASGEPVAPVLCDTCGVERGWGSCTQCLFQRQLRKYQDYLRLRRDESGRLQAVPESEANGVPYRRLFRKVGRNDPCPCGSGQKFKRCCSVYSPKSPAQDTEGQKPMHPQAVMQMIQEAIAEDAQPHRPSEPAGSSGLSHEDRAEVRVRELLPECQEDPVHGLSQPID